MKKRSNFGYYFVLLVIFGFLFSRILYLNYQNHDHYQNLLRAQTEIYVLGSSAPRGRILDTKGKVLVDNTLIKQIAYHKSSSIRFEDEMEIAESLLRIFEVEEANETRLREYFVQKNKKVVEEYITNEERKLYEERKLSSDILEKYKRERIPLEVLSSLSHHEKMLAELYARMNEGYAYQNKIILKEADEQIVAKISEKNIMGVFVHESWKRVYPYEDTLKSFFGSVQVGIPVEKKEEYLQKGYALNDTVGISYLEEQYEEYLKGEKAIYFVNADKSLTLYQEAKRGNDLVLSIDIDLQLMLDATLKDTLLRVKKMPNTEFLKESYAIIGDPSTGAILAISGVRLLEGQVQTFQEVSLNTVLSSFTVGSIVKGASHTVGYLNGVIELDKKIKDSCVKLYLNPEKCSYKELGYLDDITALKWSSNYYQFLTAIKLAGKKYSYNMKLDAGEDVFQKYRSVFSLYGLGSLTGIDIPNEKNGMIGKTISDDLLLNLTIGQYDTYTPVQLLQYMNTISNNGKRYSLSLMKEIRNNQNEVIKSYTPSLLSEVPLDTPYYDRIREGFRQVLYNGTGSGYISRNISAYGKTGTSESFYDANGDGRVDTKTISSTFAMIAPSKNKSYSLAIVTPNLSHYEGVKDYTAPFNRYISTKMSEYLLDYEMS
ncbi:MAG: penicillin-binding protein 2 [Bacilli bacterium]|nr:penicillin-binding protein 2 [Bacilli bacterium]